MKKSIRYFVVLITFISIPSCYSNHLITSEDNLTEYTDNQLVYVELKDGRIFKNEPPVTLFNSKKGIYVIDSTGAKLYKHEDVEIIVEKKI